MKVLNGRLAPIAFVAVVGLAAYALPSGLAAQAGQAPGGFVELMTSTAARPQPTASQISQFVPSSRGRFSFPAPYNTEAYRITVPADCAGADCIQQEGYSAWRNINAHAGQPVLRMFIGLQNNGYVTMFTLDKATGTVTNNGPIFPQGGSDPLSYSRGGGWFWSGSDPNILYAYATSQLVAKNVVTGAQTVVLDLVSAGALAAHGQGTGVRVWAATGSDDGNSWAVTVRTTSGGTDTGCALYHRPTNAWHFILGPMGDCFVDKSGTYWTAGVAGQYGLDIRTGTMNPYAVRDLLTDPMGAPGHLDHGYGFLIGEDNWAALGQTLKLWDLSQPFTAPGQGRIVHTMTQWGTDSYVQPTMGNARPATMATIGSQFACSTATFSQTPSPSVAREREIVCFPLDGSGRMLVVAPNMTDMNASGGGITYYRAPKGNLDPSGEYYYWITNMGGNRLEAFLVRVPWQVLMGGGSGDTTQPTVSLTAPASGAIVSGTTAVSASASDNVGVVGVQFQADGVGIGAEDTTSPYSVSWNTTGASNGSHSLTAVARDAAGNTRTSSAVSVTVNNQVADTTQPNVSLTAPAGGATVSGSIAVSATASDNVGVAGVLFRVDGVQIGSEDTTSPYSVSWATTGVANGSHSLTAIARDAAGNTRTSTAVTVTVNNQTADTTQPDVSMTAPASGATVSGSVSVSANASDNVGVVGVLFRVDGVQIGSEDTTSPYSTSWATTGVSNGSHSLSAIARDAAGNTRTSTALNVTVQNQAADTTPPTVSLTAPANGATVSGTLPVSATASDNVGVVGVQFQLDGSNLGAEDLSSPYSISWNTTTVVNGVRTLTAIARDAAGNTTWAGTRTVTISNTVPTVGGLVAAYGYNENGGTTTADTSATGNPATLVGASWASGLFGSALSTAGTSFAEAADHAALTPGTTATFSAWVYLNSAPSEVASILNKWSQTSEDEYLFGLNGRTPLFAWQTMGGATWRTPSFNYASDTVQIPLNVWTHVAVVRNASTLSFFVNGVLTSSSSPMDSQPFRDGSNSLRVGGQGRGDMNRYFPGRIDEVRIYSSALTAAEILAEMDTPIGTPGDTTPPNVSISAPANGAMVSGTVAVSATASDNVGVAGVQFRLDGANWGAEVTAAPYSLNWNSTTAGNGSHTLTAIARDAAGNTRTASSISVMVQNQASDTTQPSVSVTAPASGATVSGAVTVSATASDNVGVIGVLFRVDGVSIGNEDMTSPYSISWPTTGIANGSHALTAIARDAAGNTRTSTVVTVTVNNQTGDTTPPTVALTAPASGATVSGTTAVSANASDNVGVAGVQFRLDGVNLGAEDTTSPYSINWNTATIANGSHTLTAIARDAAGNTTTAAPRTVIVSNAAPLGGPVAAYAFNEGTGTTTADSSPGANTATLTGATWGAGRFGNALTIAGPGYANAPDTAALTPGVAATFEAWVFLTGVPTEVASILNKWSQSAEDEYLFGVLPNRRVFFTWRTTAAAAWGTPAFDETTSTGQVPLNVWTHLAVVRSGATLSFYINGVLSSSSSVMDTNPFFNGTNTLRVGGQGRGGANRYFPGRIDEARIYNRALTVVEIQADMNAAISAAFAPAAPREAAPAAEESRRRFLNERPY